MAALDREVREGFGPKTATDSAFVARLARADSANTRKLRALVDSLGWPSVSEVGEEGLEAAFLLVQHSPDHAFQESMLPAITADVQAGRLNPQDYALLVDRTRQHAGRQQLYGTQLSLVPGTRKAGLDPIEDSASVDERRDELGLPSLARYLDLVEERTGFDVIRRDPASTPQAASDLDDLVRLYEARDYFSLRDRLEAPVPDERLKIQVLRAATARAFNRAKRSNVFLDTVLSRAPSSSDSLRYEARRIRAANLLRLYRYEEASEQFRDLAADPRAFVDSAEVDDYRNSLRLTQVLKDVPPQRVIARSATTLRRVGRGEIEVVIDGSRRQYGIDTGASLSTLIRSEAEALGLPVRPAGVELGTSTDVTVKADVTVADRVRIGGIELRNVVFLVVPDEMFTFPGHGLVLRGLLGFPVIEALGELRYRPDGTIEIAGDVPTHGLRNLALHDLSPYVRVGHDGDQLVCLLDTGNDETVFYEPFYRRYRSRIEAEGTPDTARIGGAGGMRELPGYRLDDVTLDVGGERVVLPEAHVHTSVLTRNPASNVLDCNIGRDVLASRGGYTINFRSMSLLLGSEVP